MSSLYPVSVGTGRTYLGLAFWPLCTENASAHLCPSTDTGLAHSNEHLTSVAITIWIKRMLLTCRISTKPGAKRSTSARVEVDQLDTQRAEKGKVCVQGGWKAMHSGPRAWESASVAYSRVVPTHGPHSRSHASGMGSHAGPHRMQRCRSTDSAECISTRVIRYKYRKRLTSKNSFSEARNRLSGLALSTLVLSVMTEASIFGGHAGMVAGFDSLFAPRSATGYPQCSMRNHLKSIISKHLCVTTTLHFERISGRQ